MELPNGLEFPHYEDEYMMFGMIFVIGNKLQAIGDNFYKEITTKQWFVLVMLDVFGDYSPTLNELSEAMGSSHQNTKQLVLKLQNKGYVESDTDEKDKRKTRIRRTSKCGDFITKYGTKQQEYMKLLFQGIDKSSIELTLKTLEKFEKNLQDLRNNN